MSDEMNYPAFSDSLNLNSLTDKADKKFEHPDIVFKPITEYDITNSPIYPKIEESVRNYKDTHKTQNG